MGVAPKFFKSTKQEPKLNYFTNTSKGKSIAASQPPSSSKLNTSPKVNSSCCFSSDLFPSPTYVHNFHHCSERGHLRCNYRKLTFLPCVIVNISASSFSFPLYVTTQS